MNSPPVDALFLEVQEALAGEYSLERELGRGGMGVVYLAREVQLARQVALKVLPPELAATPGLREQFVREAQMAARLSHPHIVPIHRVGQARAIVYFAMAYVPGLTLGEHLRTRGPLVPDHAIRMLREVAWALTYAHASGLVHRDVKPDNIMLEEGAGRTLVTDFGIALGGAGVDDVARDGRVVGTAHYMSPEQALGEPVDARSDIYSLGVVAYYTLSGRLPFDAPTTAQLLARQLHDAPLPLRSIAPGVSLRLAQAVECCLAKDPAMRYQRASDFAGALEQSVEVAQETPAPLRIWLDREEKSRAPRIIGAVYGGMGAVGGIVGLTGLPLLAVPVGAVVAGAILVMPTFIHTRRVLRLGYTLDDLRAALERYAARKLEERAIIVSELQPITRTAVSLWTGATATLATAAGFAAHTDGLQVGAAVFTTGMVLGGFAAFLRRFRRTRTERVPLLVRLWRGRGGERIAAAAGFRLKPGAAQPQLPQATELALGRATDALYAALPKPMRTDLAHLPETVRRLEAEASTLRSQITQLEASIGALDQAALQSSASHPESAVLRTDLRLLRDRSNERLASTVAALEGIRLGLIRLQLGSAPVSSVTTALDAARVAAEDIERAADAQREVDRLLHATRSHQPVTLPLLLLALVLGGSLSLHAQTSAPAGALAAEIDRRTAAVMPRVVAWRRDVHEHPELSFEETRTAALVAAHMRSLGMEVQTNVGGHGVVGVLRGGRPGGVVALRADMDALPVTEEVDLPFRSRRTTVTNGQTVGVMHACGHDTHVAMLMGAAEVLAGMRAQIPGTIKFLFQPAEEASGGGKGGAVEMIGAGALENPAPTAIFGIHVFSTYPAGTIVSRPGGIMASSDGLQITVRGRQTHGAMPWAGVDPIVLASQVILGLQTVVSRQVELTRTPAIVTIGSIHGGVRGNIIPDSVTLVGTIRAFDTRQQDLIHARVKQTAEHIAASAGGLATVAIERGNPVTFNHLALFDRMRPTLARIGATTPAGRDSIGDPTTTAEDFALFQQKIPGMFVFLGVASPTADPRTVAPNHSPRFFADESALPIGVRVLANLAVDYLTSK